MKITEDMVTVFNQTLKNLNCSFRLKFENGIHVLTKKKRKFQQENGGIQCQKS